MRLCVHTSGSCVYSFELDYQLDGKDALVAQGWEVPEFSEQFTHTELKQLAGAGFSLGCIASINYAFYLNPWGSWWRDS